MRPATEITRQARWQRARRQAGCCAQCGLPAGGGKSRCAACREKGRVSSRNLYRRSAGIPLDSPLLKPGRPRHPS